jgi:hypothetical protein
MFSIVTPDCYETALLPIVPILPILFGSKVRGSLVTLSMTSGLHPSRNEKREFASQAKTA